MSQPSTVLDLQHDQIPNAIFGAMLGIGIAVSHDLSEQPDNILATFAEIGLFLLVVLVLTFLARFGALRLAAGRWVTGALACGAPIGLAAGFVFLQRAFITYGDVMVMSVLLLWCSRSVPTSAPGGGSLNQKRRTAATSCADKSPISILTLGHD